MVKILVKEMEDFLQISQVRDCVSAAKTVALSGFTLRTGGVVAIRFTNTNTAANMTLNINGTGAKQVLYNRKAVPKYMIEGGEIIFMMFDGTYWNMLGGESNGDYGDLDE